MITWWWLYIILWRRFFDTTFNVNKNPYSDIKLVEFLIKLGRFTNITTNSKTFIGYIKRNTINKIIKFRFVKTDFKYKVNNIVFNVIRHINSEIVTVSDCKSVNVY